MKKSDSKIGFLSVADNSLSIIAALIPIVTSLVGIIKDSKSLFMIISILLSLIMGIVLFFLRRKISKALLILFMKKTAPQKKYELTKKTLIYTYISENEMSFRNDFYIKPLCDGVNSFVDRYKWSGSSSIFPQAINRNHTVQKIDEKYGYERYSINLGGKVYNKKDSPVHTGIEFKSMKDPQGKASPHLATGIYDITNDLTLEVHFPMNMSVTNIRKLEYVHFTDEEHYSCQVENSPIIDQDNNIKKIVYHISKPIYGGRYMIDWDFCS